MMMKKECLLGGTLTPDRVFLFMLKGFCVQGLERQFQLQARS